jgi:hypothetical protein
MNMTRALLICALVTASIASAQTTTSKSAQKPSAGIHRDSTLAHEPTTPPVATPRSNGQALPVGTAIKMRLETMITTATNKPGDSFSGRVTEAVMLNGRTIIPVGSSITGTVVSVSEPRRIKGVPSINLHPQTVMLPDGTNFAINAAVVDTNMPRMNVDDEGRIQGSGHERRDVVEVAAGTTGGTVLGALAGGTKGAFIGGAIGATATIAHWLSKQNSAAIPVGTEIIMELSRDMVISPVPATAEGN